MLLASPRSWISEGSHGSCGPEYPTLRALGGGGKGVQDSVLVMRVSVTVVETGMIRPNWLAATNSKDTSYTGL
jgi:hypothetical protein